MQLLHNWINGPQNFTAGAILYQTFGSNQPFKDLLDMGETDFAKNLLLEELTKLASEGVMHEVPETAIDKEAGEMPESDNELLQALKNEWMPLYQQMNLLRHELDKFDNSNSAEAIAWRQPRARKIKKLDKQCKAIWSKKDYFLKHGKLPFVAEKILEIPTDHIKMAELIGNIKKYIRRYRKLMQDKPGEPKYVQLYNDYKQQHITVTGKEYVEKN